MGFYDEVLRELLVALGAALFLGNLLALLRRRFPAPVIGEGEDGDQGESRPPAPLARTLTYLLIGLVVALWGVASLATN